MNTREQFGKYLLLKKLTEDPLGETFRAGMLGENGMEQVVLLRVFNGQGVDGQRLWQATEGLVGIQEQLRNPNIGEGVEMGQIEGIPYVAYDYISGKNTATLLQQAARQQNFVPVEHALLVTERVAVALSAACESRFKGNRILHGFLCPHLILISNEGEIRLLGFEVASGLRGFSANPVIRQHFGRYLAPEALGGAAPHPSDDIYSLGVILLELLTGRPLPPPGPDGFGSVIDASMLATDEGPLPDDLKAILKKSLVPRDHRIPDVATWHKTLNQWMFDGQYNPTTFNLAFFMHNLFRQDIEQENQEIEVEKTLPLPVQRSTETGAVPIVAAAPVADVPGEGTGVGTGVHQGTGTGVIPEGTGTGVVGAPPEQKSNKGMLIGIAAAVLLALGAGAFMMMSGDKDETPAAATQPAPPPPAQPAVQEPTGPTEEELLAQINDMISKKTSEMEEELRKSHDKQIEDLQKQLEVARQEAEERRQREQELLDQQAQEAEEAAQLAENTEADATEGTDTEAAGTDADAAGDGEAADDTTTEPAETQVADATPPPAATPPPPVVTPPPPASAQPAAPQVRRGDLVEAGAPGVVSPRVARRPQPRFPEMARRLNRSGATVLVRALIDENGKVLKTELASDKKKGFGFDEEALNVVRKSSYKPATKDGVPVKIWHTLAVEFRKN